MDDLIKSEAKDEAERFDFEAALAALEMAVTRLESGELTLEEALKLYEEGRLLTEKCQTFLGEAALRVEYLTSDGEIAELGGDE